MYTLLLPLALLGQAPARDYDFVELGKKVDNLTTTAARAVQRLELVEDKLDTVLGKLDVAPPASPAPKAAAGPAGDDGQPWQMTYRVEDDGKEHFYVKDSDGRSRHFERPAAAPPPAILPLAAATHYAPAPLATAYYPAAPPGYVSGAPPVYTGGAVVRRGFFGARGFRQACSGTSCSLVPN